MLVDIDEKSLAAMEKDAGRWPWPRVVYAELLEGLAAQKPRAIVFDIMFTEADSFRPQDDAGFARDAAAQHAQHLLSAAAPAGSRRRQGVRIAELAPLTRPRARARAPIREARDRAGAAAGPAARSTGAPA